jgi:hypothetical protein
MARKRVQFQKGLSLAEFDERYGTEEVQVVDILPIKQSTSMAALSCNRTTFVWPGREPALGSLRRTANSANSKVGSWCCAQTLHSLRCGHAQEHQRTAGPCPMVI